MRYNILAIILLAGVAGTSGAQERPSVTVNASDIPERAVIIGQLGKPLGELVALEGTWLRPPEGPKPLLGLKFYVKQVNGKPLAITAEFVKVTPAFGPPEKDGPIEGEIWELRCAESGGFVGIPYKAVAEMPGPPASPAPYRFETWLYYSKLTRRQPK